MGNERTPPLHAIQCFTGTFRFAVAGEKYGPVALGDVYMDISHWQRLLY